jgi:broad specificity phosphatase PhoE
VAERFLDLLRHGEVQGGARFRGDQDDPLSPLGWEQMRQATVGPAPTSTPAPPPALTPDWTRIISSPARRCAEFARELAVDLELPFEERALFRERGFGAWEGLAVDEISSEALRPFWWNPMGYNPPGAEPFDVFRARVLDGWRDLQSESGACDLLVTHGGVIRVLVAEVLRMPDDAFWLFEAPHACRIRLRIPTPPWRPSLVFHRTL